MIDGTPARRIAPWIIAASAALIAWFTLGPTGGGPQAAIPRGDLASDIVLNVFLFVPLGAGLALAGRRPIPAAAIAALASAAIELAQLWWIPGRFPSIHDLISNTAGGGIGALLVTHWDRRDAWWRSLSPWVAGAIVTMWTGGALLLRANLPQGRWYAQWAHDFAGTVQFSGRIQSLSFQGMLLADGGIDETRSIRERALGADTIRLETAFETGSPPAGRAQLVAIVAGPRGEVASLWQDGTAVLARQRLSMSNAGLRTPWIRLNDALPARSGVPVRIRLETTRDALRLSSHGNRETRETVVRLSSELFWSAFLPFEYQGGGGRPRWPLLPALLSCVTLGLALGGRIFRLFAVALVILFAVPVLAHGAFPGAVVAFLVLAGVAAGSWLSLRLGLHTHQRPPPGEAALGHQRAGD